ncbi:MAG: acyltransferase [Bacteroidia bacterium]|nr:acyltransferase [Bacteroidia bacterium]
MINIAEQLPDITATNGNGLFFDKCYIELAKTGNISIAKPAQLLFHCSWLKKGPLHSILAIREDAKLILGNGYINNHLNLHCFEEIEIGEDVVIGDHVTVRDSDSHLFNDKPVHLMTQPIIIGDHVWIGRSALILKGVKIGKGAVVNKNIPRVVLQAAYRQSIEGKYYMGIVYNLIVLYSFLQKFFIQKIHLYLKKIMFKTSDTSNVHPN